MVVVKFLPRAERQFLALPQELQDEIMNKVEMLAEFPRMGQMLEKAYAGFRYLLAGRNQYRIIYRTTSPKLVEVAYIRHCRRQMGLRVVT